MSDCANCKWAVWDRTAAGRLHPSGKGKCMFTWEPKPLPKAYDFEARWLRMVPVSCGKSVYRHQPYTDCPTWAAEE